MKTWPRKAIKEGGQLDGFSRPISLIKDSSSVPPEVSTVVDVKDEIEICDDAVVQFTASIIH